MKKRILVVFGGKSSEHEVSVNSAKSVEKFIDREIYKPLFLGITKEGKWNYGESIAQITDGKKVISPKMVVHLPSSSKELSLEVIREDHQVDQVAIDSVFPIIHGTNGEDGRLQGFLEMANLSYVGSGVLGSAVAMDKVIQKTICAQSGIPITPYDWFTRKEWLENKTGITQRLENSLHYPFFVKPANLGSSVGISKVKSKDDLEEAVEQALRYDNKILVEEGVNDIKEIEIGILGNDAPIASVCAEIVPHSEFYDYDTKYLTDDIDAKIPADIPVEISSQIQNLAIQTFTILNCRGLARVDFFYQPQFDKIFLNEINTMPGFTTISMYPKMWESSGLLYSKLITRLIELGEEEWKEKQRLDYSFDQT